jgi:hypothetical protein
MPGAWAGGRLPRMTSAIAVAPPLPVTSAAR